MFQTLKISLIQKIVSFFCFFVRNIYEFFNDAIIAESLRQSDRIISEYIGVNDFLSIFEKTIFYLNLKIFSNIRDNCHSIYFFLNVKEAEIFISVLGLEKGKEKYLESFPKTDQIEMWNKIAKYLTTK